MTIREYFAKIIRDLATARLDDTEKYRRAIMTVAEGKGGDVNTAKRLADLGAAIGLSIEKVDADVAAAFELRELSRRFDAETSIIQHREARSAAAKKFGDSLHGRMVEFKRSQIAARAKRRDELKKNHEGESMEIFGRRQQVEADKFRLDNEAKRDELRAAKRECLYAYRRQEELKTEIAALIAKFPILATDKLRESIEPVTVEGVPLAQIEAERQAANHQMELDEEDRRQAQETAQAKLVHERLKGQEQGEAVRMRAATSDAA